MTSAIMTTHPRFKIRDWDGKPISEPGIYRGVPMEVYHSGTVCNGPSVSGGGLKTISNESPAHYFHSSPYNPRRVSDGGGTPAMTLGRAAHHRLMGERWFFRHFVIRPTELPDPKTGEVKPWQGNRQACKDWLAKQRKIGMDVLTPDQVEAIKGMAVNLGKHPLVIAGILRGLIEHSIFWQDKETGVWLKSRPDAIPTDSGDLANLKTTASVQWIDLQRGITNFAMHQGAALEREALRQVVGVDLASYSLVFVESAAPHCVRVCQLKHQDLDLGEKQNRAAIRQFAHGIKTGDWPGPGGHHDDAAYIEIFDNYRVVATNRLARQQGETK